MESGAGMGKTGNRMKKKRSGWELFRLAATVFAALLPVALYLACLPILPDTLPVKADSTGILSREAGKYSFDMILYSLQSLIAFGVMVLINYIVDGFARRAFRDPVKARRSKEGMEWFTLAIVVLLTVLWILHIGSVLAGG